MTASTEETESPDAPSPRSRSLGDLAGVILTALGIAGTLWGTKDFLGFSGPVQLLVLYLAVLAFSTILAFAVGKAEPRMKLWGAFASGGSASVLFCALAVIAVNGGAAPRPEQTVAVSTPAPAPPTAPTSTPSTPPSTPPSTRPSVPPSASAQAAPDGGSTASPAAPVEAPQAVAVAVAPAPGPAPVPPACQQRARYLVTDAGDVVDEEKRRLGPTDVGQQFILLDESVHLDGRHYGTVGNYTGYVLMEKLARAGTVCV